MTQNNTSIERLKELLAKATPLPWYTDTEKSEGEYGSGPDTHTGYYAYLICAEGDGPYHGQQRVLFDSHNSTMTEVEEGLHGDEYGGPDAWDAVAKANATLIVEAINDLPHLIATLETLTPSAGKVERVEAVTKAIMFADCGSTEDWQDNTNLGEAALAAISAHRTEAFEKVESYIYGLECKALADIRPPEVQASLASLASPPLPHPEIEGRAREMLEKAAYNLHEGLTAALPSDEAGWMVRSRFEAAETAIVKALSLPTTEIRREALEEAAKVADAYNWYGFNGGAVTIAKEAGAAIATGIRSLASKEEGRL